MKIEGPVVGRDGPECLVTARVAARIAPVLVDKLRREMARGESPDPEEAQIVRTLDTLGRAFVSHGLARRSETPGTERRLGTSERVDEPDARILNPMSTKQTAAKLDCGERNVIALALRGTLAGSKLGRSWSFDPVDVADLARARSQGR